MLDGGVEVPDVRFSLTVQHMSMVLDRVDPLAASDSLGIDLYHQLLEFIADDVACIELCPFCNIIVRSDHDA